ncbi:MAG: hypothetical protein JXA25_19265 [Anaerolineales bacterium]|nr:hypothetical protein [Anaerolineales bacterium]
MKHRRILYLLLPLLLLAGMVWHVYADYIGPQRTTTKRVRDPANDTWTCTKAGEPPCRLHHPDNPCPDCGGSHPSVEQQLYWCGWVADNCGCSPSYKKKTTSLDPATVSGSFTCDQPGNNGWCLGGAGLGLSAHEPLSGHTITIIEGGPGLLCDPDDARDVACSWSGDIEGRHELAFWAHSSYGDTSEKASVTWLLDTVPPEPALSVSGGLPTAGWYNAGPLAVTVTGSDTGSGFASGELRLEGGEWAQAVTIEADGIYSFTLLCADTAGNPGIGTGVVRLDSAPPSLSAAFSGLPGDNGWYRSGGTASAAAVDALSGVAGAGCRVDGGEWVSGTEAPVNGEGAHTVDWRAVDAAGNETGITQELRLDSVAPETAILSPPAGEEKYYGGLVHICGTCTDAGSGLARCEVSLNDGGWEPLAVTGGSWGLDVDTAGMDRGELVVRARAADLAGNTGEAVPLTLQLDNTGPKVDLPDRWQFTDTVPLKIRDGGSGVRRAELRIDCGGYGTRSYTWRTGQIPDTFTWDRRVGSVVAPPGEYAVRLEAWDRLGNHMQDAGVVIVPLPPTATPTILPSATSTPMSESVVLLTRAPEVNPSPEPEARIPVTGGGEPASVVSPEADKELSSLVLISLLTFGSFIAGLGISAILDRRYSALRGIGEVFDMMCSVDSEWK